MQLTHDEIIRLSPDERLALIAQLWDSLDDNQVQLTPAQQAELERRLATLDRDRTQSGDSSFKSATKLGLLMVYELTEKSKIPNSPGYKQTSA
jgi:putative addiction module component (TIGR02574 family)